MKTKITIDAELLNEYAEKIKDEIAEKFKDPMNKLIFKEGVELFMKDFTTFLFNRKEGENEK